MKGIPDKTNKPFRRGRKLQRQRKRSRFDDLPDEHKARIVAAFRKATRRLDPDYVEGADD